MRGRRRGYNSNATSELYAFTARTQSHSYNNIETAVATAVCLPHSILDRAVRCACIGGNLAAIL